MFATRLQKKSVLAVLISATAFASAMRSGAVSAQAVQANVVATATTESAQAPDPLVTLNNASRDIYRRAKEAMLARSGPIIFVEGDVVVLQVGTNRTEVTFGPGAYHHLKAVSHIALALDVLLATRTDGEPVDAAMLDLLHSYREQVVAARGEVERLGLPRAQAERQATIFTASLELIDQLTTTRTCRKEARLAYTRRMAPLVLANAAEAARAALDALDRQVRQWKGMLTAEQWAHLTVIVIGRQLPRKGNLAVQYFARLLGEPGEGQRIVYAEGLGEEPRALDLLGTRLLDTQVGADFFADPLRMHRDLLGDAARDYLPRLFEPHPEPSPAPAR